MQFLMKVNPPTRHPAQLRSLLVNCFCTCDSSCVVLISHTLLWTVIYSTLEIKFLLEPNMPCDSTREWKITTVTLFCHWLFLIQQEQSGQIKIEAQGIKSLVSLHQSPGWDQSSTEAGTGIPCRLLKALKKEHQVLAQQQVWHLL